MAQKRMSTYLVTLRWEYANKPFTRRIAENGLTPQSAKHKVMAKYTSREMVNKLGKPVFVSVVKSH